MKWGIRIVVLAVLIGGALFVWKQSRPQPLNVISEDSCAWFTPSAVGNMLVEYFYLTNSKNAIDEKIARRCDCDKQIENDILREFYSKLVWERQPDLIDYSSIPPSAWNQINDDGSEKANYLQFWQHVRPSVRAFYEKNIQRIEIPYPIVHFRCSDSPFIRNNEMHLVKVSTVKWIADKIKAKGFSKVIMLNCQGHQLKGKSSQKSCIKYADFYVEQLKNNGLEVELQCNEMFKDFAMMIYSPLLVSLNSSSFSFIAGISKNPNDYVSCNMGAERDGVYYFQTNADWAIDHNQPVLHKDVARYGKVADVIDMLNK